MPLPTAGLVWHSTAESLSGLSHGDTVTSWANELGGSPATPPGNAPLYDTSTGIAALRFGGAALSAKLHTPSFGTLVGHTIAVRIRALPGNTYVGGGILDAPDSPPYDLAADGAGGFSIYTWNNTSATPGDGEHDEWRTLVVTKDNGTSANLNFYLDTTTPLSDDGLSVDGNAYGIRAIGHTDLAGYGVYLLREIAIYSGGADTTKVAQILDAMAGPPPAPPAPSWRLLDPLFDGGLFSGGPVAAEIQRWEAFGALPVSGAITLKTWDGSAWVAKPVKVWTGAAWEAKTVKVWNGSSWV